MVFDSNGKCVEPPIGSTMYYIKLNRLYDTYQQGGLHCGYVLFIDNSAKNKSSDFVNFSVYTATRNPEQKDVDYWPEPNCIKVDQPFNLGNNEFEKYELGNEDLVTSVELLAKQTCQITLRESFVVTTSSTW